jgi:hypothetical protein
VREDSQKRKEPVRAALNDRRAMAGMMGKVEIVRRQLQRVANSLADGDAK